MGRRSDIPSIYSRVRVDCNASIVFDLTPPQRNSRANECAVRSQDIGVAKDFLSWILFKRSSLSVGPEKCRIPIGLRTAAAVIRSLPKFEAHGGGKKRERSSFFLADRVVRALFLDRDSTSHGKLH